MIPEHSIGQCWPKTSVALGIKNHFSVVIMKPQGESASLSKIIAHIQAPLLVIQSKEL